jgi:hypothetical protein
MIRFCEKWFAYTHVLGDFVLVLVFAGGLWRGEEAEEGFGGDGFLDSAGFVGGCKKTKLDLECHDAVCLE